LTSAAGDRAWGSGHGRAIATATSRRGQPPHERPAAVTVIVLAHDALPAELAEAHGLHRHVHDREGVRGDRGRLRAGGAGGRRPAGVPGDHWQAARRASMATPAPASDAGTAAATRPPS